MTSARAHTHMHTRLTYRHTHAQTHTRPSSFTFHVYIPPPLSFALVSLFLTHSPWLYPFQSEEHTRTLQKRERETHTQHRGKREWKREKEERQRQRQNEPYFLSFPAVNLHPSVVDRAWLDPTTSSTVLEKSLCALINIFLGCVPNPEALEREEECRLRHIEPALKGSFHHVGGWDTQSLDPWLAFRRDMHILKQQSKTETGGPGVGGEKTWKEVTIRRPAVIVGQGLNAY